MYHVYATKQFLLANIQTFYKILITCIYTFRYHDNYIHMQTSRHLYTMYIYIYVYVYILCHYISLFFRYQPNAYNKQFEHILFTLFPIAPELSPYRETSENTPHFRSFKQHWMFEFSSLQLSGIHFQVSRFPSSRRVCRLLGFLDIFS